MEPPVILEVENEVSVVAGTRLSQLRCSKDGRDWNTLLPSSVVTAAGSRWGSALSELQYITGLVKESTALNKLFSALPPPQ